MKQLSKIIFAGALVTVGGHYLIPLCVSAFAYGYRLFQ